MPETEIHVTKMNIERKGDERMPRVLFTCLIPDKEIMDALGEIALDSHNLKDFKVTLSWEEDK